MANDNIQLWKLNKADWHSFEEMCEDKIYIDTLIHPEDPIKTFANILHEIVE